MNSILKMKNIHLCLIFCLTLQLVTSVSLGGVTFKSGTAIKTDKDGKVYTETYAEGFEKALKKPTNTWQFSLGSMQEREGGYFGEQFLVPGTPLLRWSGLVIGDEYTQKLAKQNGFESTKAMSKYIVANANSSFIEKIGISEQEAQTYLLSGLDESDFEDLNILGEINDFIDTKIQTEIEKLINDAVESEIEDALADTIEAEIAAMINDIQNYPSGEWFQLSDGSYVCFYDEEGQC